jgi:hypothetical protein
LEGGTATGRGRVEGGKARTESASAAPAVVAVEAGMRVAVKWEARWAPETDGWVEVLYPPAQVRRHVPCLSVHPRPQLLQADMLLPCEPDQFRGVPPAGWRH